MGLENRKWSWYVNETGWHEGSWKELLLQKEDGLVDDETIVRWVGFSNYIKFADINKPFFYLLNGRAYFAESEDDLKSSFVESGFPGETLVWGKDLPSQGVPYEKLNISDFTFSPDIKSFIKETEKDFITVLCGPNNAGKSLFLKMLRLQLGRKSSLLSCNRFYHIDTLSYTRMSSLQYQQNYENWERNLYISKNNDESSHINFANIIQEMKDAERIDFFGTCREIIGFDLELRQVDEENVLSPYRINLEGRSLSLASTGVRLFLLIIASLYDKSISQVLIDEPELGLSPPLQEKLSSLLNDQEYMSKKFPNVKKIYVATHSHLFLSKTIANNFSINRENNNIMLNRCSSFADYHRLQFNLLGNNIESLFFPSAIVIVEGKTDLAYMDALIRIKLPDRRITVMSGQGNVKKLVNDIKNIFYPIEKSPMRTRLFVVNDKITQPGLKEELEKMGVLSENIVFWSKNGIEYLYPNNIMSEIFSCTTAQLEMMKITEDTIKVGDNELKKNDLCKEVIGKLNSKTELPHEFNERFFNKLVESIS